MRNKTELGDKIKYKITTKDMELAIVNYFNPRENNICANVSWGIGTHECDLLVITPRNLAIEVEIKISRSDLRADAKKQHQHISEKIKELYFAIPYYLRNSIEFIPPEAGILVVGENKGVYYSSWYGSSEETYSVELFRPPKINNERRHMTDAEVNSVLRLGAMRVWTLKQKISKLDRRINELEEQNDIHRDCQKD